jgi:hypothetical protein
MVGRFPMIAHAFGKFPASQGIPALLASALTFVGVV